MGLFIYFLFLWVFVRWVWECTLVSGALRPTRGHLLHSEVSLPRELSESALALAVHPVLFEGTECGTFGKASVWGEGCRDLNPECSTGELYPQHLVIFGGRLCLGSSKEVAILWPGPHSPSLSIN